LSHETIKADPGLLRILLTNLITNAWKYSQIRDEVVIEMGKTKKDQKDVYFIKDNGLGFDMKYYGKLFQPFQRLHAQEKIEGTGIGLATVARVVKRHGGDIWAESKVGDGATFFFRLS
jgi:light-regulated signal transduction histidine kinase (bacteriophytochrome)